MSTLRARTAFTALGLASLSFLAAAYTSSPAASAAAKKHHARVRPTQIFAAPTGLAGAGPPQPNGTMWLLAGATSVKTLHAFDLADHKQLGLVPVGTGTTAVTELSTGVVVDGTGTAATGSLELRNGSTGALVGVIPMGDPVMAVAPGSDGNTVYVLDGTVSSESVTVVDAQTRAVVGSLPVSTGTVAVAPTPDETGVFALGDTGEVTEVAVAGGKVETKFKVGKSGLALALSPDGSTLYVLQRAGSDRNVAVVNVATEGVTRVLPAPADTVGIVLSPDGSTLYDLVGSSKYGNIQSYSVNS